MSQKTKWPDAKDQGYSIQITGRHVHVTDAMKEYAVEKIEKVERFSTRLIDVTVIMDIQKLDHIVEIILRANNIKVRVEAISDNMYASIDKALSKLQARLRKYKNKLQKHQAKPLGIVDVNVNVLHGPEAGVAEVNDEIEEQNLKELEQQFKPHVIAKTETRPLKTLNQEEAIMKMELSGDSFLVYRCEEDNKLKVMYRRGDGNFGVIEPE